MIADLPHVTRRPLAPSDASAWAALLNAVAAADQLDERYSVQDAEDQLANPVVDFERGTLGMFDGETMVGYSFALPRPMAEGTHRVLVVGAVHPDYRRQGLGTELIAAGIMGARAVHAIHHPELPLAVDVQANEANAGAVAAYRAAGMTPVRWYVHMTHPLGDAIVDAPMPEGFVVEGSSVDNDAEFLVIRNEAYLGRWGSTSMTEEQWRARMDYATTRRDLSFLVREPATGTAVGMLLSSTWDVEADGAPARDLFLLSAGTRHEFRKRGIASALISHALRAAQADSHDQATLEVDTDTAAGAHGLYERLGFAATKTEVRYALDA